MTPKDRDRALRCIAQLMDYIRPDWDFNGCLVILRRLPPEWPITKIARGALWFAENRTDQRTPAMLAEDGSHWHLDDRNRTPQARAPQAPLPPLRPPTPEERAAAARCGQAIRDARRKSAQAPPQPQKGPLDGLTAPTPTQATPAH